MSDKIKFILATLFMLAIANKALAQGSNIYLDSLFLIENAENTSNYTFHDDGGTYLFIGK